MCASIEPGPSGIKSKNKLAVFEHLRSENGERANFSFSQRSATPMSDCNNLVIDDEYYDADFATQTKKRNSVIPLTREPLSLVCGWSHCSDIFTEYRPFIEHINNEHAIKVEDDIDSLSCLWKNCNYVAPSLVCLIKHVTYHGYHVKLMSIGSNIVAREKLPDCRSEIFFEIPDQINDYECSYGDCDGRFLTIFDFFEHIRLHINSNPKTCPKGEFILCKWPGCSSKQTTQWGLLKHIRTHTKEKVTACPTCGNLFITRNKFIDHRNRQLPIEMQSYQCSQCSKLFPSERLLRDHMRNHINHYKCSMCDMTCPKPSALARHIRYRHLGERPFKCNLCDHSSITKENLEGHLLSHCAEKLMACEECNFRCRSLYGLDRHYQTAHGEQWGQKYECHICQKPFHRGNFLTKHLMKEHKFNWPSGHSRFRYKEDTDGVYRLQIVRYESLEVTQEMMLTNGKNETQDTKGLKYSLLKESDETGKKPSFILMISESGEENVVYPSENNIIITVEDVDESGNVVKSETVESNEIICAPESIRNLRPRKSSSTS